MHFFVDYVIENAPFVALNQEDSYHISAVLRMRTGQMLTVFDAARRGFLCRIDSISKSSVSLEVVNAIDVDNEPDVDVTVFAGLSKGDRFETLIQKCVECGASHIVPFTSENCVIRLDSEGRKKKVLRYSKIALEASKQSRRCKPVTVGEILDFSDALLLAGKMDASYFLYENEGESSFKDRLEKAKKSCKSFAVFCGPEGGFTSEESKKAVENGLECVSLGKRIMRCETAPVAALCAIMYATGNFDIGE